MPIVFPYGISFFDSGNISLFPAAKITMKTKEGDAVTLRFFIDSGATYSILPCNDADTLGVKREAGQLMNVGSISGDEFQGWLHEVDVQIGDDTMRVPIIFLDDDRAPRVLGREGIFNQYMIILDEQKLQSIFVRYNDPASLTIREILT